MQETAAVPPNYKTLTTPQLKAALRAAGVSFEGISFESGARQQLIELCEKHGVVVTNDLKAAKERAAAELRRAVNGDDADELRAAIKRAKKTR
eukprot:7214545-Prymnesium_polylepis.1